MHFRTLAHCAQVHAFSDGTRPVTIQYGVGHVTSTVSLALPTFLQKSQKNSESPRPFSPGVRCEEIEKGLGL